MRIEKLTSLVLLVSAFLPALAYCQTPTPTARDVISELIEQAAKETSKNERPNGETTKLEPWQTSPDEFAKELQRLFSKGADESELAKRFRGKQVDWPGILDTVQTERSKADPNITLVAVWITDVPLVAPDGSPAYIGELALNIPKFVMPADKHVKVRASLSNVSTMPVINEKNHSKQTAVMVETEGDTAVIALAPQNKEEKKTPLSKEEQKGLGDAMKRDAAAAFSSAMPAEDWCKLLLKAPMDKNLPKGYSNPQISLIEMTSAERTGGMRCKISVVLHGPDSLNAIRYRIYENEAAAERALNSLSKTLPPDITLIYDDLSYNHGTISKPGRDSPCMVFTAGNRKLTFVSCADQIEREPIVVSGVSSEPNNGSSWSSDTTGRAGKLLKAGIASLEAQASEGSR